MELWIRSQDKTTLIKSYEIYIAEYDINSYVIRAKRTSHILGTYKTIERALEVLDEIQNLLKPPIIIQKTEGVIATTDNTMHIINPTYGEIKQLSTIVYEMPKE